MRSMANGNWETVAVARVVPQKADAIWRVIRSGGEIDEMLPGVIETCRVEGVGAEAPRYGGSQSGPLETVVEDLAGMFTTAIDGIGVLAGK